MLKIKTAVLKHDLFISGWPMSKEEILSFPENKFEVLYAVGTIFDCYDNPGKLYTNENVIWYGPENGRPNVFGSKFAEENLTDIKDI